jgi:hypothetical protein
MTIRLNGSTSGYVEIDAPAVAGSNTLILPGGNGTADQALVTNGSGTLSWADRGRMVQGTIVNSTSGTSIDFTGIPSWVKRVTVAFNDVSTNGTSNPIIQLGAGSFTTSGYSSVATVATAATTVIAFSAGFGIPSGLATNTIAGQYIFTNQAGNTWVGSAVLTVSGNLMLSSGRLNLSGTLDRVRITTVNGTDTFDAGLINILYEG